MRCFLEDLPFNRQHNKWFPQNLKQLLHHWCYFCASRINEFNVTPSYILTTFDSFTQTIRLHSHFTQKLKSL